VWSLWLVIEPDSGTEPFCLHTRVLTHLLEYRAAVNLSNVAGARPPARSRQTRNSKVRAERGKLQTPNSELQTPRPDPLLTGGNPQPARSYTQIGTWPLTSSITRCCHAVSSPSDGERVGDGPMARKLHLAVVFEGSRWVTSEDLSNDRKLGGYRE